MKDNILVNGAKLSRADFAKTIPEFGIMPFWFVNGGMEYSEMEYQLKEYKAKGVPGIYFHSRFGTLEHTGYLTGDWFDRLRFAVKTAKDIGLQIWVYDEYNWPSGTAGKEVMRQDPNLTQRYLELVEGDIPGQFFTFMEGTDSRYNDLEQSQPVYACAVLLKDIEEKRFEYIDLMPNLAFDKVVTWQAPEGPWKLMYFIERQASWYADVLNDEATDKFIKLTHERYKQEMDGPLKHFVPGFYTDEPAMHYFEVARDNFIIPWSRQMRKIFKEHNGYDLLRQLPKLFYDFGGDTAQVRYDFWSALTKQYERTFFKKIRDWCDDNEVIFTGHLLFEEWLRLHARTGGNLFTHLKHLHMTGVDHLYPRVGSRQMPDEHVALKLASSAAHHFGSVRLLCESMGGAYWDCTMERMKWIADWEYVLGVNLFNPHGFHYSIEGERKRDWPPSMFYQHTWWPQYKVFNDYVSRMGYLLSGGHHAAKIAMFYPINSIWAQYTPQAANPESELIQREFNWMTDRLLRLHLDFDYLDEDVMDDCALTEDGAFTIKGERYEALILPGMTHIKAKTMDRLEAFVKAGGKVLATSLLPYQSIEGDGGNLAQRVQALFGVDPHALHRAFLDKTGDFAVHETKNGKGRVAYSTGNGFSDGERLEAFEQTLRAMVDSEILIDSQEVFCLHRVKDGEDFFFLCNPTRDGMELTIRIKGRHGVEEWDLQTGSMKRELVLSYEDGYTVLHKAMPAIGSIMLHLTAPGEVAAKNSNLRLMRLTQDVVTGYGRVEDLAFATVEGRKLTAKAQPNLPAFTPEGPWQVSFLAPNALVLQHFTMFYAQDAGKPEGFAALDLKKGIPMRMGGWAHQLPTERDEDSYPVDLVYIADFEARYLPEDLALLIDGFKCKRYELFLNGEQVKHQPVRSYLDAEILTVPLHAKPGKNRIAIRMRVERGMDGLLDMLKLTGTFTVGRDGQCEYLDAPGSTLAYGDWCHQGYPYLAAMVDYEMHVDIPKAFLGQRLLLECEVGDDLFEAWIDGAHAGVRMWQPYQLDITDFVSTSRFHLKVRVVNTIANLLEASQKASGLFKLRIVPHPVYTLT